MSFSVFKMDCLLCLSLCLSMCRLMFFETLLIADIFRVKCVVPCVPECVAKCVTHCVFCSFEIIVLISLWLNPFSTANLRAEISHFPLPSHNKRSVSNTPLAFRSNLSISILLKLIPLSLLQIRRIPTPGWICAVL